MGEPKIPAEITAATSERLLTLFAELTHKIHGMRQSLERDRRPVLRVGVDKAFDKIERLTDTEAQRDLVKRELLSRMERL